MKKSLAKRLFIITLSLFIALMAIIYFAQSAFFEDFYSYKKTNSLVSEVKKFNALYSFNLDSNALVYQALRKFEDDNNAKVLILSVNGNSLYYSNGQGTRDNLDAMTSFCAEIIEDENLISSVVNSSQIVYKNFYNYSSDLQKIGVIAPFSLLNKNDCVLICVSSIQSIEEASQVINEFMVYLFIGFILVAIILTLIYSNIISKPLLTINAVANKMSNMDFSVTCPVESDDEIGNLARTLNFLSYNLEMALMDLKTKNKKLQDDIEKERQLENMRKDFIANVSHELKTPIGIIEGYAEGIKDGIVSGEDSKVYLETIIDEAKKMSVLVTNMLELSKLESGSIKPTPEHFNINRLINKVLNKHKLDFEDHNLTLNYTSSIPYGYVYADPFQMEQVMTNLITNAIKYTPDGNNINVLITENQDKLKISVQNMGTSIPNSEIDRLFDKFYRIDKSRKRNKYNSTGIGLSIVKNILMLHNCEFNIQNIDNGVEFYFIIDKVEPPEE